MELKGKKLWQIAPNPLGGRPALYDNALDLWEDFLKYCQWVDENPWEEKVASNALTDDAEDESEKKSRKRGSKRNYMRQGIKVLQRPYTLYGFATFAGIYHWSNFKAKYKEKKGFDTVICAIENAVKSQQIDGAMVKQFDSNLVARLNGIIDTTKQVLVGNNDEPLFGSFPKLSAEDIETIKKLNEKL